MHRDGPDEAQQRLGILTTKRYTPQTTPRHGVPPSASLGSSFAGHITSPLALPGPLLRTTSDPTTSTSPPQQERMLTTAQTGAASDGHLSGPLSDRAITALNLSTPRSTRPRSPPEAKPSFDPKSSIMYRSRRLSLSRRRPLDAETQFEEDDNLRSAAYGNPKAISPDAQRAKSPSSRTAGGQRTSDLPLSPRELRDERADSAFHASMAHADDMFDRVLARRKSITSSRASPAVAMRALANVVGEDMVAHALSLSSPRNHPSSSRFHHVHSSHDSGGLRSPPHHQSFHNHHHNVPSSSHLRHPVHPSSSHTISSPHYTSPLGLHPMHAGSSPRPLKLSARTFAGNQQHNSSDGDVGSNPPTSTAQALNRLDSSTAAAGVNDLEADLMQHEQLQQQQQ